MRITIIALTLAVLSMLAAGCGHSVDRVEIKGNYSRGRVTNLTNEELNLEKILQEAAKMPSAIEYAKGMFDVAYIIAEEHENLGFTVRNKENEIKIERGLDTSVEPTIVIPLTDTAIYNIKEFFKDNVLDEQEEFLVVNALFKPGWEASYRIPGIQNYFVRKYMNLDGLLHAVLLNPSNIPYKEKVVRNELSIIRVSDQWLVFTGLEGKPDVRMEIGFKDAKEMYRLVVRDLGKASQWDEKKKVLEKFQEIRNRCIVKK